ncbi:thiopeptide-type bacteriocin biosynthesis protein [Streptomyces sp. NPDC020412]|uniref:thiopeptide-type bacteriocin biosynthesis protein n=1 Tax=Streptomyces sp. NPDC020412 TaxID=3365073 RepID=UPI00379F3268
MDKSPYPEASWVQLNMTPRQSSWVDLYGRLADTARDVLSARAGAFFFMHKPPGLRVRFQAADAVEVAELRAELLERTAAFEELAAPPVAAVYEPESYLFGGEAAMPWVHELFTADSLAWLDLHTGRGGEPAPTPWRVSLLLVRELLAGLDVVGWEHRGVWEAVRSETGRALPAGWADADGRRAAEGIRQWWARPREDALAALPGQWPVLLAEHRAAVARAAEGWHRGYFTSGEAVRGPRRAAAYAVIFHWNRGRIPTARQRLLTEALADDGTT